MSIHAHRDAVNLRLSNNRIRLATARTERERVFFQAQVALDEKELAAEVEFLASQYGVIIVDEDELLRELMG